MMAFAAIIGSASLYVSVVLIWAQQPAAVWKLLPATVLAMVLTWLLDSLFKRLPAHLLVKTNAVTAHVSQQTTKYTWPLMILAAAIPVGEGLTVVALLGLWLFSLGQKRCLPMPADIQGWQIVWWLAFYGGAGSIAWLLSGLGLPRLSAVGRWLPLLILLWGISYGKRIDAKSCTRVLQAFTSSLALACCFALGCYFFDVRPLENWVHIHAASNGQALIPHSNHTVAGGFYFHRLIMAHVCLLASCGLLAHLCFGRRYLPTQVLFAVLFAVCGLIIVLCATRAAAIALLVVTTIAFASVWQQAAKIGLIGGGGLLIAGLLWLQPWHTARPLSLNAVASERSFALERAATIIDDFFWGVGFGNYPQIVGRYYDQVDPTFKMRTYPHNLSLAVLAEGGPLALAGWWGLFATLLQWGAKKTVQWPQPWLLKAGLLATIAVWVLGLSHDVFYHTPVAYTFWGLWALIATQWPRR